MDFLGLFDPAEEDSDVSSSSGSLGSAGLSSPESSSPEESSGSELEQLPDQLPPEPQLGNIEYKLKLVSPSKHRFQHLVTQVSTALAHPAFSSSQRLSNLKCSEPPERCSAPAASAFRDLTSHSGRAHSDVTDAPGEPER